MSKIAKIGTLFITKLYPLGPLTYLNRVAPAVVTHKVTCSLLHISRGQVFSLFDFCNMIEGVKVLPEATAP